MKVKWGEEDNITKLQKYMSAHAPMSSLKCTEIGNRCNNNSRP